MKTKKSFDNSLTIPDIQVYTLESKERGKDTMQLELDFTSKPKSTELIEKVTQFLGKTVTKCEQWVSVLWVQVAGARPTFVSLRKFGEYVMSEVQTTITITVEGQKAALIEYIKKLPLEGSEKQIKWAGDIRNSALTFLIQCLDKKPEYFQFIEIRKINQIIVKEFKRKGRNQAEWWIDSRYKLGEKIVGWVFGDLNNLI